MSIPIDSLCIQCHLRRTLEIARPHADGAALTALTKDLLRLYLSMPADVGSSAMGPETAALLEKYCGIGPDRLHQEKADSNRFVMERMDSIRQRMEKAADPVFAALQFSVLGNYLDFAALQGKVSFDDLDQMLDQALEMDLDRAQYRMFREDLSKARRLLYLTDNAGEIAFDRVFAETLQKAYPQLAITFCVRGGPVHNDATREDALAVGVPFPVIDSGCAIGGTQIERLGAEARRALDDADIIIAKGMGNTEMMAGCGCNVYYAFLVKCERFVQFFHKPLMTPMFINDRSIEN